MWRFRGSKEVKEVNPGKWMKGGDFEKRKRDWDSMEWCNGGEEN